MNLLLLNETASDPIWKEINEYLKTVEKPTVYVGGEDTVKMLLEDRFLDWSSVLDYQVTREEDGDHLELVVFPGRVLPKINADVTVSARYWDPNADEPFCMKKYRKISG